ncbi:MAG: hypothetical protein IJF48_02460 [Clostridia bacterium]|nr:hypothetical protein [Clostridia bacterium]
MTEKEYISKLRSDFSSPETRAKMSDDDMIALLLSFTDCKNRIPQVLEGLRRCFGTSKRCFFADYTDLIGIDGMSHHAAILLLLTAKVSHLKDKKPVRTKNIKEFDKLFLGFIRRSRDEEFWVALINEKNDMVEIKRLAVGNNCRVDINVSDIITFAAYHNVRRVVVAHTHPDGNKVEISEQDKRAIKYMGDALEVVGIELIGQVIVSGRNAEFFKYERERLY